MVNRLLLGLIRLIKGYLEYLSGNIFTEEVIKDIKQWERQMVDDIKIIKLYKKVEVNE